MKFPILNDLIVETYNASTSPVALDEIDAIENDVKANLNKDVKISKDILDSFQLKELFLILRFVKTEKLVKKFVESLFMLLMISLKTWKSVN